MCAALGDSQEGLLPYQASSAQPRSAAAFCPPSPAPKQRGNSSGMCRKSHKRRLRSRTSLCLLLPFHFFWCLIFLLLSLVLFILLFLLFYYFLRLLVHTAALQPSLCTHPSPQVAVDSTHSHPHCWKGRHKSCPTAGDLHPRTGGIQEGDEEQAPGKKRAQTTSTTWETAAHPLPEQVLKPTHKCIARRNKRYLSKTVFLPQILPSSFCPFLDECQGDRKAQNEPKQSYSDSSASSVSGESSN